MIEFEDDSEDEKPSGLPGWMATFADLMSLLMCFFVLLLAFSEMDVLKYKEIAGSMRNAFGVQNKIAVRDIPKGTSVISQEFSPGRVDRPTDLETIQQKTTELTKRDLDLRVKDPGEVEAREKKSSVVELGDELAKKLLREKLEVLVEETKQDAEKLKKALKKEIDEGMVDIESRGRSITVRIRERGSFGSGSDALRTDFMPVMVRLREVLAGIKGKIAVEGHTDDVPIANQFFRSNWDLSSARALMVAHELFKGDDINDNRFLIVGYADTKPFNENSNAENRARNRRVEIVIRQGFDDETSAELKKLEQQDPELLKMLNLGAGNGVPGSPQLGGNNG